MMCSNLKYIKPVVYYLEQDFKCEERLIKFFRWNKYLCFFTCTKVIIIFFKKLSL